MKKSLAFALGCRDRESICRISESGVFVCGKYYVALYKIKEWSINIHELTYLDYVYSVKKFLDVFNIENCKTVFYTDVEPVNVDEYLSKLNHAIQMKLVELEIDKANTKLRSYIEKLMDTRKRVLMGIKPVKSSNIIAVVCNNISLSDIEKIMYKAKSFLDIDLEPILEPHYADFLINFRLYRDKEKTVLLDTASIPITMFMHNESKHDGIYVGIDLVSGATLYWNPLKAFSSHILVVGPTGSGKTQTLLALAYRFRDIYRSSVVFIDVKNEFAELLKLYSRENVIVIDSIKNSLPICFCSDDKNKKINSVAMVVNTLTKIFSLTLSQQKLLRDTLIDICMKCSDVSDVLLNVGEVATDKRLGETMEIITELFNTYQDISENILNISRNGDIYVVNLKSLFLRDRIYSSTYTLHFIKLILEKLDHSVINVPKIVIVIDELWHSLPYISDELISILTRYGRSLGITIFMATQGIDDLHPHTDVIASSCGGFISMASHSLSYWQRVKRYLNLSNRSIEKALMLNNQGEAVARFSPQSTPVFLYIDPLE